MRSFIRRWIVGELLVLVTSNVYRLVMSFVPKLVSMTGHAGCQQCTTSFFRFTRHAFLERLSFSTSVALFGIASAFSKCLPSIHQSVVALVIESLVFAARNEDDDGAGLAAIDGVLKIEQLPFCIAVVYGPYPI